ncbi:Pvstp1 [Plasmodium cynomolgi strain B]|uniref:Pvstp1 n=1 Tax=Plasmodium cynomolgi (strain B) TaxID=1120755 RepID=K6US05_PLACD|nr:Pvstp1 [Plasmodium cynomolgi strain B]GAB65954.1 Pvstp1 [Plasmodium cynomolgi strain B]
MEAQATPSVAQETPLLHMSGEYNKWKTSVISDFISNFNNLNSVSKPKCKGIYRNLNYWLDDNRDEFVLNKAKLFGITSPEETWLTEIEKPLVEKIESLDYLSLFKRAPYKYPKNLRDVLGEVEEFLDERDIYVHELNIDCKSDEYLLFKDWIGRKKDYLTSLDDWHLVEKNKNDIPPALKSRFDVDNVFKSESYCRAGTAKGNSSKNLNYMKTYQPPNVNKDVTAVFHKDFWANFPQSLIYSNPMITVGIIVMQCLLLFFLFKKNFYSDSSSKKRRKPIRELSPDGEELYNPDGTINPAVLGRGNKSKNEYYAFYPVKPNKAKDTKEKKEKNVDDDGASSSGSEAKGLNKEEVENLKKQNLPDDIDVENLSKKNTYVFPNEHNDGLTIIDIYVPLHNNGEEVMELTKKEVLDVCRELFKNRKSEKKVADDDKELVKNGKKYVVL